MATGCALKRVEPQWQSQLERLINDAQYSRFTVNYLGLQVVDVGQARSTKAASAGEADGATGQDHFDPSMAPSSLSYRRRYWGRCGPTSEHMPINREG